MLKYGRVYTGKVGGAAGRLAAAGRGFALAEDLAAAGAFQDSLARGFNGVYLTPVEQAVGFYARFPGYQILDGEWFWSAKAIQALLGG